MTEMLPPRGVLVVSYFTFALAGMFFMFWRPTIGLEELLGQYGFIAWNVFLILGGLIGVVGAWWHRFRIEIIASPFLTAGLAVYGFEILTRIGDSKQPGALAGIGSIFVGSALLFFGKGLAIWIHKIRVADAVERRTTDGS